MSVPGHKQTFRDYLQNVRLYEALAVKEVLVCVAWRSLLLVTPLCPGRVLR